MKPIKLLILFVFIMCIPAPAFSAGNLKIGALEIHPYVSVKETYNDNIFAVAKDTTSDWITTITPGIKLALPYKRHMFTAEYNAVIDAYSKYSSEDTTDHNARIMADFKIGSLFGLKLSDTYAKGHEPRVSSTSGQIEQFERNAPSVTATYQLADRSKIQMDYTRTSWNFKVSDYRSRDEDFVSAYFYYRFLPKTSAFVEYDWKNVVYNQKINGLDSRVNSGFLGMTWEMTAATRGTIKGGYLQKRFEDANKENFGTWGASADISHAFSDYSLLKIIAMREVNESSALGTRYFVTTGAYAEYTHKLTYKISAVARASYGVDDYSNAIGSDPEARYDKTFVGGVGLKYQMQDWLEFVLAYDYRNRNSNLPVNDLRQNTYMLTANFAL
jgi:polysaccharide biosynthesis protein VpsM